MHQKSINLVSSTDYQSYIQPLKSNYQNFPYNQTFNQNTLPNSLLINQNYVQVPRSNLMASVNQPYISNSRALPLSSYPIIVKGIVQSQHIPPNSIIRQLPITRHPQYDLNPNFDYEQANFLCQSKITEEDIYCPVCNIKYLASQKEKHIQKHIRKPTSMVNTDASNKIKQYFARQHKVSGYKIRPIVQPQEGYAQYKPNTYKIIQKIIYEDRDPNIKQRSIGHQEKQPQYINKEQEINFQLEPESNNFLSNYHNSVKQPNYIIGELHRPDQPVIYAQPNQEFKLPIYSQIVQIEPQQQQIYKKAVSYDNNNLQRRTMTAKANAINPIQQPKLKPINEEPVYNQQQQNINVQSQNYFHTNNSLSAQKYPLKRSLASKVNTGSEAIPLESQSYNNVLNSSQNYPLNRTLAKQASKIIAQNNPMPVYSNQPERIPMDSQNYDQIANYNQSQKYPLKRSLVPKTLNNNTIPAGSQINNEPQRVQVEAQSYNNLSSNQNSKYPLRRSLNPQPVQNNMPSSLHERDRASFNQNQNNTFQNQQPNRRPQSQADSFSNAHDIKSSSKNLLSKKDSQAYFSQFIGDNVQEDKVKGRKKVPYRSQW